MAIKLKSKESEKTDMSRVKLYYAKIKEHDIIVCAYNSKQAREFVYKDMPKQLMYYNTNKNVVIKELMKLPFRVKELKKISEIPKEWSEAWIIPWGLDVGEISCCQVFNHKKILNSFEVKQIKRNFAEAIISDIVIDINKYDDSLKFEFKFNNGAEIKFEDGRFNLYNQQGKLL